MQRDRPATWEIPLGPGPIFAPPGRPQNESHVGEGGPQHGPKRVVSAGVNFLGLHQKHYDFLIVNQYISGGSNLASAGVSAGLPPIPPTTRPLPFGTLWPPFTATLPAHIGQKRSPWGGEKKLATRKGKTSIGEGSAAILLGNIIRRCWPVRLLQGDVKKKVANRKGKNQTHAGSGEIVLKNIAGRCWPGRRSRE